MADGTDIIAGAALIDNLIFADGTERENVPGGAGLYALAGAALFSDGALLVTGTGEDVSSTFGPWMARNGLGMTGLRFADPHTPRNILRYLDEHSRTEIPVFGQEHFARIEPQAKDLQAVASAARSAYIFRNTDPVFWAGVIDLKQNHELLLLWEIGLDACSPRERPNIERLLAHVDAWSLNLEEAALIFGTRTEERLVEHLHALPVSRIFLRAGRRGSFAIANGAASFVPSLSVDAVDVTRGGNAYSGAALVGLADGQSVVTAAAMGTVAASFAIAQYGPFEPRDPQIRRRARHAVTALRVQLSEEASS